MRIAFYVRRFPVVSETFIVHQITGLLDRAHDVVLWSDLKGNVETVHADVERYHLIEQTRYRPWPSKNGDPYIFDIIHCHFGRTGLKGVKLRKDGFWQGKLVTTFYGFDVSFIPQRDGIDVYTQLFNESELCIVISDFMKAKLIDLGCPESKLVKVPVGIDVSRFPFFPRSLRPGEPVKFLSAARFVEKKGLEFAIRAVARLIHEHPEVEIEYRIVGDGELRQPLTDLIYELGLSSRVHLLGYCTEQELGQHYREAHILILASVTASSGDQEGTPVVLLEAQASGLPVVATQHSGIPEIVEDGGSGFLVPERDVEALAEKLGFLVDHPEIWPIMGHSGHRRVGKDFELKTQINRLIETYKQVLP